MIELPMSNLQHRVLTSRERVKFAAADPYAHLSSGACVDMIMGHRVEALEDIIGFSILRHARTGVAFPARSIQVAYLRPSFVGEALEVGSWIETLGTSSFEVRAVIAGAGDRKARAAARIHFVAVDAATGRPVPVPATLPSNAPSDPTVALPMSAIWLADVQGLPDGWVEPVPDIT
ncbi:MAG TPA: thioesterase family protein [Longimicrobiales bacterium]|nr:thioesterase family protein [Longimicrobiales bacterium]